MLEKSILEKETGRGKMTNQERKMKNFTGNRAKYGKKRAA